mmetsp:Transcript_23111/g.57143  ORF Transcript_23111/g.57143 Transcript_23111/m.57143 type:complete len:150 (+) Transcript_23111:455-904(+)
MPSVGYTDAHTDINHTGSREKTAGDKRPCPLNYADPTAASPAPRRVAAATAACLPLICLPITHSLIHCTSGAPFDSKHETVSQSAMPIHPATTHGRTNEQPNRKKDSHTHSLSSLPTTSPLPLPPLHPTRLSVCVCGLIRMAMASCRPR